MRNYINTYTDQKLLDAQALIQRFESGCVVKNVNPISHYHGWIGVFDKIHEWWTFAGGITCDVFVPGKVGPYDYPFTIMTLKDLIVLDLPQG